MTEAVNEWLLIQKMLIHWDAISWSILTVLAVWKVAKTVYISWAEIILVLVIIQCNCLESHLSD